MSNSLKLRDKQVIWHPYTPQKYMPDPIPIVKGDGCYLTDTDGNDYIDAISSWWVTIHGHAHPYIAEKLYEQAKTLEQVIFAGFTHEPAVRLAERLLEKLPGAISRIFYSDNGSTATEVALKMSIQYWWNKGQRNRNKILAFNNSYHGDTFGAMSVSERSVFTLAFQDKLFEVIFIDVHQANFDISQLDDQGIPWEEVACLIYEPLVQGAGGMLMYEAARLDGLIAKCQAHEVICIADEVMTGFGRTGKLFASHYLEHQPDIVCLSKGLTGGTMALGVTACTHRIYEAFLEEDKLKTFFHGHSFTANPLACAAALASLDLLEKETCQQNIDRIGQQHQSFASRVAVEFPAITKNIRCCGTLFAFELVLGKDEYLNNIGREITQKALSRGVYLRPLGNTVYLMPPYCITEVELEKVYLTINEILGELNAVN
ncbi:adenosylmethionine--8-amino-7-oxononanoate transaminase [Paraflavitalea sp. CAU 1676]|uniref:adenosylmethionine--8-amino-7-oxononanoate transaminase n=1 Tax=Paraflavitalea sp. CAU 1676 TaxID=3032598 RepID=UPI0023DA75D1|nr:adenosylmethionine--8-amino-7-oxononanoate transaminase [Paraflavitalea sp. CAU 1676]MDF2189952.1 adenosylmethionine--8-amino-7-oxononanoate transaminase [Paraflavitalea sp. CAU 1676]